MYSLVELSEDMEYAGYQSIYTTVYPDNIVDKYGKAYTLVLQTRYSVYGKMSCINTEVYEHNYAENIKLNTPYYIAHADFGICNNCVEIANVGTKEDWQCKGIMYNLLNRVINRILIDAPYFELEVWDDNYKAISLYEKLGFKSIKNLYYNVIKMGLFR